MDRITETTYGLGLKTIDCFVFNHSFSFCIFVDDYFVSINHRWFKPIDCLIYKLQAIIIINYTRRQLHNNNTFANRHFNDSGNKWDRVARLKNKYTNVISFPHIIQTFNHGFKVVREKRNK